MPRFTGRGVTLLLGGLLLVVVGALARQRDIMLPGVFLMALPLVAIVAVSRALPRQPAKRQLLPQRLPAREVVRVELSLPASRRSAGVVHYVEDSIPAELGDKPAFVTTGGDAALSYQLRPRVRGRYALGPVVWHTQDALGLVIGTRVSPVISRLTVTPEVTALQDFSDSAGVGLDEAATHRTGYYGADDILIRDYQPRDDIRKIHWRSTARTGQLMVRRDEQAWDPSALVLLDSRAAAHHGRGTDSSLEWAVRAAASICAHAARSGFRIDIVDAAGAAPTTGQGPAPTVDEVLEFLTDVKLTDQPGLERLVGAAARRGRSQLIVLISDRLTGADGATLLARPGNRQQRCVLLGSHASTAGAEGLAVAASLRSEGWHVVDGGSRRGVAEVWRLVSAAARR